MRFKYLIYIFVLVFLLIGCKSKPVNIEIYDTVGWNELTIKTLNECCKNEECIDMIKKILSITEQYKRRITALSKVADFIPINVGDTMIFYEFYSLNYGYKGFICHNKYFFRFELDENDKKIVVKNEGEDIDTWNHYMYHTYIDPFDRNNCCPESMLTYFGVQMKLILKNNTFDYVIMDLEVGDSPRS